MTRLSSAVFFDLDGVLVDSRDAIGACLNDALRANGLASVPEAAIAAAIGPPIHEAFAAIVRDQGAEDGLVDPCVRAYRERYRTVSIERTTTVPGIRTVLQRLAERYTLAIVSSKPYAFAAPLVERLGIAPYFAAVHGPTLEAVAEPKRITLGRALAALDGPRLAMVGDRDHDVVAAAAHGIPTVGVTWGIGTERELRDAGAAAIVREPAELAATLATGLGRQ